MQITTTPRFAVPVPHRVITGYPKGGLVLDRTSLLLLLLYCFTLIPLTY